MLTPFNSWQFQQGWLFGSGLEGMDRRSNLLPPAAEKPVSQKLNDSLDFHSTH